MSLSSSFCVSFFLLIYLSVFPLPALINFSSSFMILLLPPFSCLSQLLSIHYYSSFFFVSSLNFLVSYKKFSSIFRSSFSLLSIIPTFLFPNLRNSPFCILSPFLFSILPISLLFFFCFHSIFYSPFFLLPILPTSSLFCLVLCLVSTASFY